jgi:peptide/nickel transport system substrate-binding protein
LKVRSASDLINADPAFHPSGIDGVIAETVGQGLVSYKPGTWEVINVLAESIHPSADGLRIDFKLKQGVQFQGGFGELTADDVKFSYERFLDPKLNAPYKGDWAALDKVEVKSKYEGTIVLKESFAPLWTSTLPVTSGVIVSKKAMETMGLEQYATHPIGTGPYEFKEWRPQEKIVLKRFAGYWGRQPDWEEIEVFVVKNDSAAEIALESGELDFSAISKPAASRFETNPNFSLIAMPSMHYGGVFINVQHPLLKDIDVRQAIRYAIDVPAINTAVYDGRLARACAIVSPSQIGYWVDAPCYDRDVDKARDYLKKAGVTALDLTLTTLNREDVRATAEIIQANLADIGVKTNIQVLDDAAYWEGGFGDKGVQERQLTVFQWGTTNPDPHWQMVWFSCKQIKQYNWMVWCNPEFDRLNAEAAATLDPVRRSALYIEAQKIWDKNANVVWTVRPALYFAARTNVIPVVSPVGIPILPAFRSK